MPNVFEIGVFAWIAIIAAVVIAVSVFADRRRTNRHDLDRVGFMPWSAITVLATIVFAVFAGLAIKT